VPFVDEAGVVAVEVDDVDAVDDTDEDELARGMVFRGMNMPLTSSLPFKPPHAGGRFIWEKVGGLATAVMRKRFWSISTMGGGIQYSALMNGGG
jgi:hypothetical protein